MNLQEFSTEFDVLYNNITSNQAPGLNEYEKSVFLTKAQAQLVNEYFNARTDGYDGGFDGSEKRQYDFSGLIRVDKLFNVNAFKERVSSTEKLDRRSIVFLFPKNYFLAVNEILSDSKWQYSIMPLSYAEYQRLMLKPYNFPVKRAAWRILTDKKDCNYVHEDSDGKDVGDRSASSEYMILSTWADQKRNLKITIKSGDAWTTGDEETLSISDTVLKFKSKDNSYNKITASCAWSTDNKTCEITLNVTSSTHTGGYISDDETVINILKEGFEKASKDASWDSNPDWNIVKAGNYTDGFMQASAPSNFKKFGTTAGKEFNLKVISLPLAEIIGKFTGDLQYQLRYVRTLGPIILEDLDNYADGLTIDGTMYATECTLPEETHQEILERAVTLAKIAWQGATSTQAANAQQRSRERE